LTYVYHIYQFHSKTLAQNQTVLHYFPIPTFSFFLPHVTPS